MKGSTEMKAENSSHASNYIEGIECDRLCKALTFMGCAGPASMEELAINMADPVNRLTRAVMSLKDKLKVQNLDLEARVKNLQQVVEIQADIIKDLETNIDKLETDAYSWRDFQDALARGEDRS